ncbi:reverse transcriptase domain-containing protein [Tanacetum coccineum]
MRLPVVTMVTHSSSQRTMAELLQAPTEGYGDAIVIPANLAENFELKHGLLNLVTSKQFYGSDKEDPHAHIHWFNKITSTIKYKKVPNSSIKLMLFPFSIEGAARIWLKKEPPHSLNAAAGGNLLTKTPRDALTIIENKSKVRNSRNKPVVSKVSTNAPSSSSPQFPEIVALADAVKAMLLQKSSPPASVKAVEQICVTCGGPHPYHHCLATDGNAFPEYQDNIQRYVSAAAVNYNQGNTGYRPQSVANQIRPPGFAQPNLQNNQTRYNQGNHQAPNNQGFNQGNNSYQALSYPAPIQQAHVGPSNELSNYMKVNEANMQAMQNQISNMKKELRDDMSQQNQELKNMMTGFLQMNTASSSGSGSLPSNTVANPRGDLKAITTRSGIPYDGPPILSPPLHLLRWWNGNPRELHFELCFTDALLHMPKFASMFKSLLNNKEKLFDLAKTPVNENCLAVILKKLPEKLGDPDKFLIPCDFPELVKCLALADLGASINLMPLSIWKKLSLPELTPTQMILELADRSTTSPSGIAEDVFVKVGKLHFPANFVVVDYAVNQLTLRVDDEAYAQEVLGFSDSSTSGNTTPSLDPILSTSSPSLTPFEEGDFILEEIEACLTNDSIPPGINDDNFDPEGDLLFVLEEIKACLSKGTDKLPVIISKELKDEEKSALLKVLKSHKRAIAWKIFDIKGIDPRFCTHKILMEDDFKSAVKHQRRANPKIHEVIKLFDAGLIYPISDSSWVSPVCIPKKGGMTVVENEDNKLIPTRLVTGWRVCIDYRKLNDVTCKDHFLLPFMDQMLERLVGNEYYCFLDGFSRYFQIPIDSQDQEKTTFTCPYGTFAYRHMPFGLCNAPGTFQRCSIGHAGFYRRFIQDFSKIARPMTHLLEKETPFIFSKECIEAFNILKKKLTEASILVAPDWDLPFKIMYDASDYAVGAVLGQRKTKHFQPIQYASKTMTDAQAHYTITEKELLAVVYAFEKFRPYLVLSKTIVYTDHSALKYLLAKQDAKRRLSLWILILQEFDVIIRDKKRSRESRGRPLV